MPPRSFVAYLADQPVEESAYNRTAFEWADRVDALAGPELTGLALQALTRITGDDSELADLRDEGPSTWRASIAELAAKLRDVRPDPAAEQLVAVHFRQSAARALAAIPATDGPGIYAALARPAMRHKHAGTTRTGCGTSSP